MISQPPPPSPPRPPRPSHRDEPTLSTPPGWNIESVRRERRALPRQAVEAAVTAVYQSCDEQGADPLPRTGVTPLELVDTSVKGLGVLSPVELPRGTRVSIVAAQAPVLGGASRACEVVRCEAEGPGVWSLGLRYRRSA